MAPLHNFDTDMLCTRLQFLSTAQKRHPPKKKERKAHFVPGEKWKMESEDLCLPGDVGPADPATKLQ